MKFELWCWILTKSVRLFSVEIGMSKTVDKLIKEIKKDNDHTLAGIDASLLNIWKLSSPIPSSELGVRLKYVQSPQEIAGCVELDPVDKLSEHFSAPPPKHLHIIVQLPPPPFRKHSRSPSAQGDGEAKKKRTTSHLFATRKKWTVNGAITECEVNKRYYVDPGAQNETSLCLNAVTDGTNLLLVGPRASGKSTRLIWLRKKLEEMGYWALYISFEDVLYRSGTEDFWRSFGKVIVTAAAECGRELPIELTTPISSRIDLKSYFCKASWDRDVVLLLDEFSYLYQANDNVRDDCLLAFRGLKQNCQSHAVKCLIAAGTFSIVYLNPSTSGVSPFNVADIVQCPSFTIDETRKLFLEFAKDLGYSIDDAIVEDVWAKSNGLVAQLDWCIVPKML
ncbi:hypothetical protein AX14_007009 [Amanita brunnescens Koide BX004]|nr:hypothetical protein AX14_007009 [Amanita brunnescens Koide BX004]